MSCPHAPRSNPSCHSTSGTLACLGLLAAVQVLHRRLPRVRRALVDSLASRTLVRRTLAIRNLGEGAPDGPLRPCLANGALSSLVALRSSRFVGIATRP